MKKFVVSLIFLFFSLSAFAADRIVVLSPSGCEILFAIGAGDKIAARTDFCNFPAEAEAIKSVGGFDGKTLSIETIVSYEPDLVYGSKGMHDFLKESCDQFGIELYLSSADSVQGVFDEIIFMGTKTGCEENAEKLVSEMKVGFERIQKKTAKISDKKRKSVYWEIWNAPYMSIGGSSFINELIYISGGKNIFADITDQAYPMVSEESILSRNPQVIILPFGDVTEVPDRNGWKYLSAVKNKKIYNVNDDVFSRPGPRILEAAETLSELLK
ncbi:MAG: ABC transporter substrate-binding protein [Treponema sp.]|nr:ABC transporter substrate-binding protein [Treponema sp.]